MNVYMPYEDNDSNTDEYIYLLSLIEDVMLSNADSHFIVGGDFNVDFNRSRLHTNVLNKFCDDVGLAAAVKHANSSIDYTYQFCMDRFHILDHFLLSTILFQSTVAKAYVDHCVDNISDHDPIFIHLNLDFSCMALPERIYTPHLSWVMANENDLHLYRANLSCYLSVIRIPYSAVLCSNMKCIDQLHVSELNQYSADLTRACLSAGLACIPQTRSRKETGRIPGWSEEVEPLRQKSLFWHGIWIDCGRPKNGPVADCMRRTRAAYHYAIRCVRKQEESIVRDRIAHSLLDNSRRDFWAEVKKNSVQESTLL